MFFIVRLVYNGYKLIVISTMYLQLTTLTCGCIIQQLLNGLHYYAIAP